jgi:hypothetical protein
VNQLLQLFVHGAHAFQQFQKHREQSQARQRAHGLSHFAGIIHDACEKAGFSVRSVNPDAVSFWYQGLPLTIVHEECEFVCYAGTGYTFNSAVPREVEELLERRNASLRYGLWGAPWLDEYYAVTLRVRIVPDNFDVELFREVTGFVTIERNRVMEILERAGYSRT